MTRRRLQVAGGLLVLGGAVLLLFVLVDRTQEPTSKPSSRPTVTTARLSGFGEVSVRITDPSGVTKKRCLLAARSEQQQTRGLMRVLDKTLEGHDGMAFLFKTPQRTGFWMRNTPMPLSIAYFDQTGQVVSMTDMRPCGDTPSCPSYPPAGAYSTAIEVPQGRLASVGIERESRVAVGGTC